MYVQVVHNKLVSVSTMVKDQPSIPPLFSEKIRSVEVYPSCMHLGFIDITVNIHEMPPIDNMRDSKSFPWP